MNVSAGPLVEPLNDQQEKGSLASGAVAHRSTPGTAARVGRIGCMKECTGKSSGHLFPAVGDCNEGCRAALPACE